MTTVFSRVVADVSNSFMEKFPDTFDFLGVLQRICEDAGVNITASDKNYTLHGLWNPMERAHRLLVSTLAIYGASGVIRKDGEVTGTPGSRPFTALVEAAEVLSRNAELSDPLPKELLEKHFSIGSMNIPAINPATIVPNYDRPVNLNQYQFPQSPEIPVQMSHQASNVNKLDNEPLQTKQLDDHFPQKSRNGETNEMRSGLRLRTRFKKELDEDYIPTDEEDYYNELGQENIEDDTDEEWTMQKDQRTQSKKLRNQPSDGQITNENDYGDEEEQEEQEIEGTDSEESVSGPRTRSRHGKGKSNRSTNKSALSKNFRKKYMTHRLRSHKTGTNQEENLTVVKNESLKRSRGRPKKGPNEIQSEFPCNMCDFIAKTRNALGDHKHRIHFAKPTKCDICDKVFPNLRYMKRHRASHVGPQHVCDICGKMYKVLKALRDHRKRHDTGYKRPEFSCQICSKTFCTRYIMDCHIKSEHMGIRKSFLCSVCGKSFTTKHTLQQHANVHVGARPYPCNICGKSFSYESALRDHKYIHAGVKKFVCKFCTKAFRQRSALKMHEKIHSDHKDFVCGECGRGFTQKQALQRHVRAHKGDKPFSCKLCGRTFGDASIIRRHMILVHKIHKDPSNWREDIVTNVKSNKDYYIRPANEMSGDDDSNSDVKNECHALDSPLSSASTPTPSMVQPHSHLPPQAPETPAQTSLDSYSSQVHPSQIEAQHPSINERPGSSNPYAYNAHLDYTQHSVPASSTVNHYSYTAPVQSIAMDSHYQGQTLARSADLNLMRLTEHDYSRTLDHTLGASLDQPLDATMASSMNRSLDNTAHLSRAQELVLSRVEETTHGRSADVPSRIVDPGLVRSLDIQVPRSLEVTVPVTRHTNDALLGQQHEVLVDRQDPVAAVAARQDLSGRQEEIAKRLHEIEPPENLSISSLYAYYTSLASQYMNMTNYSQYIAHPDNSGNQ
ncbi:hypothetical protein CHS0354_037141 [Potamilus streckersoni]|uniref:C2H2-type domain-containing protein n=1 Tax=Potamilus streckersoni TaxID=2493646 RepID=A0AAE0VG49_9BIVA|nr:hypothetical protein CHS0354_037141 [Potamilus streckersoni]